MWILTFLMLKIGVSYELEYEFQLREYSLLEDKSEYVSFNTHQFLIGSYNKDKTSKPRAKKPDLAHYIAQGYVGYFGAFLGFGMGLFATGDIRLNEVLGIVGSIVGASTGVTLLGRLVDLEGSFLKSIIGASIGAIPFILATSMEGGEGLGVSALLCIPIGAIIGYYWK